MYWVKYSFYHLCGEKVAFYHVVFKRKSDKIDEGSQGCHSINPCFTEALNDVSTVM